MKVGINTNKIIVFYVSCHGFGHLTRCMAIIDKLIAGTRHQIMIISGQAQIECAKHYYSGCGSRIEFGVQVTDVGLINHAGSIEINVTSLENRLLDFIDSMGDLVKAEITRLSGKQVIAIVTDISILGIRVAKALDIVSIGISNFTWYNQYETLRISQSIKDYFLEAYTQIDEFIAYGLHLDLNHIGIPFDEVGIIAREIDHKKVNYLKIQYGHSLFVSCGMSAKLENIFVYMPEGTVFATSSACVSTNGRLVLLDPDITDMQNYIAASDMAIIKAGWSTVAECLIGGTGMALIDRPGVVEDQALIDALTKEGRALAITPKDLSFIDAEKLFKINEKLERTPVHNDVMDVIVKLLQVIENIVNVDEGMILA